MVSDSINPVIDVPVGNYLGPIRNVERPDPLPATTQVAVPDKIIFAVNDVSDSHSELLLSFGRSPKHYCVVRLRNARIERQSFLPSHKESSPNACNTGACRNKRPSGHPLHVCSTNLNGRHAKAGWVNSLKSRKRTNLCRGRPPSAPRIAQFPAAIPWLQLQREARTKNSIVIRAISSGDVNPETTFSRRTVALSQHPVLGSYSCQSRYPRQSSFIQMNRRRTRLS